MSMIDLTNFTLNTGTNADIEARYFAHAAYHELPNIADWTIGHDGSTTLHHDNGETFVFDLEETDGTVDGWTYTVYDTEGDDRTTDGGPVRTTADLAALVDEITRWAEG